MLEFVQGLFGDIELTLYRFVNMSVIQSLQSLKCFNSPTLKRARHISSHDYEAVDFRSVYDLCMRLISKAVCKELTNFLEAIESDSGSNKQ